MKSIRPLLLVLLVIFTLSENRMQAQTYYYEYQYSINSDGVKSKRRADPVYITYVNNALYFSDKDGINTYKSGAVLPNLSTVSSDGIYRFTGWRDGYQVYTMKWTTMGPPPFYLTNTYESPVYISQDKEYLMKEHVDDYNVFKRATPKSQERLPQLY